MSLFGSLFSGVSGMAAQSQAMGIISDNISNVNTIGYKGTSARFSTLVTNSSTVRYSPGGVRAEPHRLIAQQGLGQASESATDVAISGNGFFVVNSQSSSTSEPLYTRAGSFRQDELGNLVNTAGFFLQGWLLDNAARLPGAPGNVTNTTSSADISSLETVNVNQINGVAAASSEVSLGANLKASEPIFQGPVDTSVTQSKSATTDLAFTDGHQITFTSGTSVLTVEYDPTPAGGIEFSTLTELAALINANTNFSASIGGTTADANISVTGIDPRESLVIANVGAGTAGTSLFSGTPPLTTINTYDETSLTLNIASGSVTADFSRSIRVFDAQGSGHDLSVGFLKVDENTWAVEVFAVPASDIIAISPLVNSQIATGTITFNGDASLNSISGGLAAALAVNWTNGASPSAITVDWGTAGIIGTGLTDGLTQFDSAYNIAFVSQNGSEVGELNGVTVDSEGFVIASFNNGQTKRLYKLPIATFGDVSRLESKNGNAFAQTDASGEFNLREAGTGGAGVIASSSLEAANVDLAKEFTDMIVTQRAFSASSKVISTVDEMLDELIRQTLR